MTGTNCDLFTHNQSPSYLNLVLVLRKYTFKCRAVNLCCNQSYLFPDHSSMLYHSRYVACTGLPYIRFLWHPQVGTFSLTILFLAK
jgi:hypothetical protein